MNNADRLDKVTALMRARASEGHPLHTAAIADLRVAVASLVERKQIDDDATRTDR